MPPMTIGLRPLMGKRFSFLALAVVFLFQGFAGAEIDTQALQQSWPKQRTHDYELGRHNVRWRQKLSKQEGLWAGVSFTVPQPRSVVWGLSNDYSDVGKMTPGVQAVRIRQEGENRKVVEVDMKILWKALTLTFEFEENPPDTLRFRWHDKRFGEYTGVAVFTEVSAKSGKDPAQTAVELSTRFKPYRPVPLRLLLGVERMAMLSATRDFLKTCEKSSH